MTDETIAYTSLKDTCFVLLGASNLTLAFPMILESLCSSFDGHLQVFAALGHGRSYGRRSHFIARSLPGITECGLWRDFPGSNRLNRPPLALLTDVGNDLLYGVPVTQVVDWVKLSVERLARHGAEIIVTSLPMPNVRRLYCFQYHVIRAIFFPLHWMRAPVLVKRVKELNDQIRRIADRHAVRLVEPVAEWYGFDPIHIHWRHRREAWQTILSHWHSYQASIEVVRPHWRHALQIHRLRPAERRISGIIQRTPQPVLSSERVSVRLY